MNEKSSNEFCRLLTGSVRGDPASRETLMEMAYDDLRRLARSYLISSPPKHGMQATTLVHEAFLRLAANQETDSVSRSHFFAIAAKAMRQILVSHFRKSFSVKRGGRLHRVPLEETTVISPRRGEHVLAVEEALVKLEKIDELRASIVEMRFFGGMTIDEVATEIGVSPRTVKNLWASTRAWLRRELSES